MNRKIMAKNTLCKVTKIIMEGLEILILLNREMGVLNQTLTTVTGQPVHLCL